MSNYGYSRTVGLSYPEAVERVTQTLKEQGFGILTQIDVKATLKEKLGVDFPNYIILGACNPPYAHKSLQLETELGLLLPCNVIVHEDEGRTRVAMLKPTAALGIVGNPELDRIAEEVEAKVKQAIDQV